MVRVLFIAIILMVLPPIPSAAESCDTPSGQPVPRFVTLRFDEAIGRAGPSSDHPKVWIYNRLGLPMEVIAETPNWRRVRDPGGEEVWMHRRLLSGRRALWTREASVLYARHDTQSSVIAEIEAGVVLSQDRCRPGWCRVEAQGFRGWVQTEQVWGISQTDLEPIAALEGGSDACYRSPSDHASSAPSP